MKKSMNSTASIENGGDLYPRNHHAKYAQSRRECVKQIYSALELEYGAAFTSQFLGLKTKTYDWKCRLMEITKDYTDAQIINGADRACQKFTNYPPTIRQIHGEVQILAYDDKREKAAKVALDRSREPRDEEGLAKIAAMASNLAATLKIGGTGTLVTDDEIKAQIKAHKDLVENAARAGHEKSTGKMIDDVAWCRHWEGVKI